MDTTKYTCYSKSKIHGRVPKNWDGGILSFDTESAAQDYTDDRNAFMKRIGCNLRYTVAEVSSPEVFKAWNLQMKGK